MIKIIIQSKEQEYKFSFVKKYFVKGGVFDFNNYSQKTFFNLMSKLSDLTNNKEVCLKDIKYHYHQINFDKIKNKCSVLYKTLNKTMPLFQIAITPIERLLFYQIEDEKNGGFICFPVGYDKYHFLNSAKTTHPYGINTNKYKYSIYDKLGMLTNYQRAEELIVELFKEEHKIRQDTKKEIIENLKKQCLNLNKKNNENYKKIVTKFLDKLEKNF
jgi:hypothetical protein